MRRIPSELPTAVAVILLFAVAGCPGGDVGIYGQQGSLEGQVTLELVDDYSGAEITTDEGSTTTTDAEGHYRLEFVSAGDVEVTASHPGYVEQTQTVHIEAEETTTADFDLELTDTEPTVSTIDVDPDELLPGETAEVTAQVNNPDEMPLDYEWEATEGFELTDIDDDHARLYAPDQFDVDGQITVRIEDPREATDEATVGVSTRDNSAPVISELTIEPPQAEPGAEVVVEVEAHDPDDDAFDYEWSAPAGWSIAENDGDRVVLEAPDAYDDSGDLNLEVVDEFGAATTAEVVVSTIPNQGPWIEKMSADPILVERTETTQLEADVTHPQDLELSYDWEAPDGWELFVDEAEPHRPQLVSPDRPAELAIIDLTVTDPEGVESTGSLAVATMGNNPPVIVSLVADPEAVEPAGTTIVTADAYDPDGQQLDYNWNVPSGWSGGSNTAQITLQAPGQYERTDTVELEVFDGYDTTSATVAVSTIGHVGPVIESFTADPQLVEAGGTSDLTVVASHPHDQPLTYNWSDVDAGWNLSASGDTALLQTPDVPLVETDVGITVEDDHGGSASASLTVATDGLEPPTIQTIGLDSDDPDDEWISRDGTGTLTALVDKGSGDDIDYDWTITGLHDWYLASQSGNQVVVHAPSDNDVSATVLLEVTDEYGGTDVQEFDVRTRDTIPDPFEFEDREQVDTSTMIESDTVTLSNFDGPLQAVCDVCELSINNGPYSSSAEVWPGDDIQIRVMSHDELMETIVSEVTVGDTTSEPWEVTTFGLIGSGTEDDPYRTIPPEPSCWAYQEMFPEQVEDGIYLLDVNNDEFHAWCDVERHGGGWTMVLQAPNERPRNSSWCQPDAYDPPSDPEPKEQTFKFSEQTINAIRDAGDDGMYRFTGIEGQDHFFQSHTYRHQRDVDNYAPARQYWTSPSLSGSPDGSGGGHHSVQGLASGHWSPYTSSHKHSGCFVDASGNSAGDSWGVMWVR